MPMTLHLPERPRSGGPGKLRAAALAVAAALLMLGPAASAQDLLRSAEPLAPPARGFDEQAARWSVEVDLDAILADPSRLEVTLPDGLALVLERRGSDRHGPAAISWHGVVADREGSSAVLSVDSGWLSGALHLPDAAYRLRPSDNLRHEIVRYRWTDTRCPGGVVHPLDGPAEAPDRAVVGVEENATARIEVLVLYTPAAANSLGGSGPMAAEARAGIAYLNQSLRNSAVDAQASMVGLQQFGPLPASGMGEHLDQIRRSTQVAALREQAGADVVHLYVNAAESDGEACGLAYVMLKGDSVRTMAPFAFGVTDASCDIPVTFAHEVGHNLGLNHNPDSTQIPPARAFEPWSYGHRETRILGPGNAVSFKTVMSYGQIQDAPYFSSPDVFIKTVPLGIPLERDNARTLRTTTSMGARFSRAGDLPGPVDRPTAPSDLTLEVLTPTSALATWTDNSDDETSFVVETRDDTSGDETWRAAAEAGVDATSVTVSGFERGRSYSVRVRAKRGTVLSTVSNVVTVDLPAGPRPPQLLTATPSAAGGVVLSWEGSGQSTETALLRIEARGPGTGWFEAASLAAYVEATDGSLPVGGLLPDTPYTFRGLIDAGEGVIEYGGEASATTGVGVEPCRDDARSLCVQRGRFEIRVAWEDHRSGDTGVGTAVPIAGSEESGLFWFFNPTNIELVVKQLDGRFLNDSFWSSYGALSDVEYWVTVRDTETGASRTYHNQPSEICGTVDINAFPELDGTALLGGPSRAGAGALPGRALARRRTEAAPTRVAQAVGACVADDQTLCLAEGRFQIRVAWINPRVEGDTGFGHPRPELSTADTGFFWFFGENNVELAVKVLDGTPINGKRWVFWGSLTDVQYTIEVLDTETGATAAYDNPAFNICGGADTSAF